MSDDKEIKEDCKSSSNESSSDEESSSSSSSSSSPNTSSVKRGLSSMIMTSSEDDSESESNHQPQQQNQSEPDDDLLTLSFEYINSVNGNHNNNNNRTSLVSGGSNSSGGGSGGDEDSLSSSSSSSSSSSATSATSSDSVTRLNEINDEIMMVDNDESDEEQEEDSDPDIENDANSANIDKKESNDDSNNSLSTTTTNTTTTTTTTSSTTSNDNTNNNNNNAETTNSNFSARGTTSEIERMNTDTRRRVKLYMLNANRTWDDRGTGHVSSSYIDRLNGMSLLVKAETDGSTLLESKILVDTAYQKQQDTLIVWSEGDNYDLALSFQERVGCEEIWAKICQVQGKDPSVDVTQDLIEDEENELPPVEINRLDEINSVIASSLSTANKKDNITLALESDNYILKLLELFRQLDEQQDIPNLQKIYEIFKNIFLLNKNSLIEIMLSDNAICDVIGVFEYDPNGARVKEYNQQQSSSKTTDETSRQQQRLSSSSPTPSSTRALSSQSNSYFSSIPSSSETQLMRLVREKRHREFLSKVSRFKEVIPLERSDLVSKIHQTYRVQYIQDVIMPTPSVFEENMLSTLSSVLFFNKIEIVTLIQEDEKFLKELFRQLSDDTPSFNEKRKDLVLFLKELCTFSHTLQNRETFIKTLSSMGLLPTIETLLVCDDPQIKLGAVDLLTYVVDYSPSMVREYALQQEVNTDKPTEQYIINIIIEQMICDIDPDLGMAQQLSGILKLIIDPDNMLTTPGLNKTEKSEFLNYFYKHCIYYLTAPILAATVSNNEQQLHHQQNEQPSQQTTAINSITSGNNNNNTFVSSITFSPGSQLPPPPPPPPPTSSSIIMNNNNNNNNNNQVVSTTTSSTSEPLKLAFENSCQAAQLLAIILELLTFCIEHHAYHIRTYLLQREVVRRIMILTKSRHTFLVLTVIRFMRKLIGLKDEFYNRHIVTMNLFQPIIDAFLSNRGRYNLLDSAVIDLFEYIDHDNITTLLNYTVERFWKSKLERIDYVRTFKSLKRRYDQQQRNTAPNSLMFAQRNRFRRDPRQLEKEEDMWFNADDDDDEDECADDDEDDECENYHEDDDDGNGSGSGSPPSPSSSIPGSMMMENRLVASLSDPVDYAQQYGSLSLHHHGKQSTIGTVGSPILHHHHHPHQLNLSSLHQVGGATNTGSVGGSPTLSCYNDRLTSSTTSNNPLYDHNTNSSNTSLSFESPFFPSLTSSVAAVGSSSTGGSSATNVGNGSSITGTIGSGVSGGKKKPIGTIFINLNHKKTSFLSTGANNNNNVNNNQQQQQNTNQNSQQQQSANVLSAFSSGLCNSLSSINSSMAAVVAGVNAVITSTTSSSDSSVTQLNHLGTSSTTNSNSPAFRSSSMGQSEACAAAAFHLNNQQNNTKTADSTVLSRKALVDYPDEDSDDELENEDDDDDDEDDDDDDEIEDNDDEDSLEFQAEEDDDTISGVEDSSFHYSSSSPSSSNIRKVCRTTTNKVSKPNKESSSDKKDCLSAKTISSNKRKSKSANKTTPVAKMDGDSTTLTSATTSTNVKINKNELNGSDDDSNDYDQVTSSSSSTSSLSTITTTINSSKNNIINTDKNKDESFNKIHRHHHRNFKRKNNDESINDDDDNANDDDDELDVDGTTAKTSNDNNDNGGDNNNDIDNNHSKTKKRIRYSLNIDDPVTTSSTSTTSNISTQQQQQQPSSSTPLSSTTTTADQQSQQNSNNDDAAVR